MEIWSIAKDLGGWIIRGARSGLRVETLKFKYGEIRNRRGDRVVVISSYDRFYSFKLGITNRTDRAITIRDLRVFVDGREHPVRLEPMRLEAGDYKESDHCADLRKDDDPVESGGFLIEVIPAVGRKVKLKGEFPIPK